MAALNAYRNKTTGEVVMVGIFKDVGPDDNVMFVYEDGYICYGDETHLKSGYDLVEGEEYKMKFVKSISY